VAVGRAAAGSWSIADPIVAVIGVSLSGIAEWAAHRHLFHAPADSLRARRLGAGRAHRRHHLDPLDLRWVRMPAGGAALMMALLAGLAAIWSVPVALAAGAAVAGPYLSALGVAWAALAHYEWTHLLVHASYRPQTRFYRRLARNHRLHHHRNESYWFGVTSNLGDRLLGTLPAEVAAVPLTETGARSR
jgi:hypothetical protein